MKRALAVVAACGVCGAAGAQTLFGTIALTSEQVPGLDPGVRYGWFFGPMLNQEGEVAFRARLYGPGMYYPDDVALMAGRQHGLMPVVRTQAAVPGTTNGEVFGGIADPALVNGVWSFIGSYHDGTTGASRSTLFVNADEIRQFALPGDTVPDTDPPALITSSGAESVLNPGGTASGTVYGQIAGTADTTAYLSRLDANNPLVIVAARGDPAPGLGPDVTFWSFGAPTLNSTGDMLFAVHLDDADSDRGNDTAYYTLGDSGFGLVARQGDHIYGRGTLDRLGSGSPIAGSENGGAVGDDGTVTAVALFRQDDHTLHPILVRIRHGQFYSFVNLFGQVPGFGAGTTFVSSSLLHVFDSDRAIVGAQIQLDDGTVLDSIWLARTRTMTPIAVEGDALPDGNVIAGLTLDPKGFHANASGQMVFGADLVGTGVEGLLVYDEAQGLRTLITTRDSFEVAPGDVRAVGVADPTGGALSIVPGKGGTQMIDNHGGVVMRLLFRDGTQGICFARLGPACRADLTTTNASAGDPGYGVPDGAVTAADLLYYVNAWVAHDPAADLTTRVPPGDFRYALPDGYINTIDLNFFLDFWLAGCL